MYKLIEYSQTKKEIVSSKEILGYDFLFELPRIYRRTMTSEEFIEIEEGLPKRAFINNQETDLSQTSISQIVHTFDLVDPNFAKKFPKLVEKYDSEL